MSPYLRTLLYSLPPPPSSNVLFQPFLFPIPDTSFVPVATPRPLQVYTRHPRTNTGPPIDTSPMAPSSTTSGLSSPTNLPIVIRKGTRSSRNPHHIYSFLAYLHHIMLLFPPCLLFHLLNLCKMLSHPGWKQTMVEEMMALHSTATWDLVCCWLPLGLYS